MKLQGELRPTWARTLRGQFPSEGKAQALLDELVEADRVWALSTYAKNTLVEDGVRPDRIDVLPLGVDTRDFYPVQTSRDSPFNVLFLGQMTERKGLSDLIEAFEMADLPRGARLTLVGPPVGNVASLLAKYSFVNLMGPRGHGELRNIYNRSDVFVLPSVSDGFAATILEAMACGTPVITSDRTCGPDLIGADEGFVVPARHVSLLAERLNWVATHPSDAHQMGRRGRLKAVQYSWSNYQEHVIQRVASIVASMHHDDQ